VSLNLKMPKRTGARATESANSNFALAKVRRHSSDVGSSSRRSSKLFPLLRERVRVRASVSPSRLSLFLFAVLLIIFSLRAFAHDPYEITSTIRLETNRTLVEIEMEFNGAMLLVGVPRSQQPIDQSALFQSKLSDLQHQAGQFFEIADATGPLSAISTNVTLGVENHVKFSLDYPPTRTGLKLNATAVKSLAEHGPFGTTVTVLDMVNKTVLGQSVLFSNSPAATFAPPTSTSTNALATNAQPAAPVPSPPKTPPPPKAPKPKSAEKFVIRNSFILGALGILLLILLRRWRAAGGSQ